MRRGLSCLVAVIVVLAGGTLVAGAQASIPLVLSANALPGYHGARVSTATARADLGRSLARHVDVQAVGATGKGRQLRSEAFAFAAKSQARTVADAWKRSHRARATKIGSNGSLAVRRSGKRIVATVVWREGAKVGLLRLAGKNRLATSTLALQFARAADSALRSPVPATAYGKVLAQVHPDGSVSKATALQLFALTYSTKVPGVKTPKGPSVYIDDASAAATLALHFRDRVTRAQRVIIDKKLGLTESGTSAGAADYGDPEFAEDPALTRLAQSFVPGYERLLGHKLALPIVAGVSPTALGPTGKSPADSLSINIAGGTEVFNRCRIRAEFPRPALSDPILNFTMAHEVFHCFQFDITHNTFPGLWVQEGLADWAALNVHPVRVLGSLRDYIGSSGAPLFARSYDALGFWGHVQDVTGDLWTRIPEILKAKGGVPSYQQAVGTSDFLSSWGSSVFRSINGNVNWGMASPPISIPGLSQLRPASMTDIRASQPVYANPWTTAQYKLKADPDRPLVNVAIDGHARLSDALNYTQLKDQFFCTSPTGCSCPPDKPGSVPSNQPLDPDALLGLSAAGGTTTGLVAYHSLDEFCEDKKNGINGTWDGSYQSSKYPRVRGTFTVTFAQKGTKFSGLIRIRNSDCVAGGSLTGKLDGARISFGVVAAKKTITYAGKVSGDKMSGSYSAPGCGSDRGTWSASR